MDPSQIVDTTSGTQETASRPIVPEAASKCLNGVSFFFAGRLLTLSLEQARAIVSTYGAEVWDQCKLEDKSRDEAHNDIYKYVNYTVFGSDVEETIRHEATKAWDDHGRYPDTIRTILDQKGFYDFVLSRLDKLPNVAFPSSEEDGLLEDEQEEENMDWEGNREERDNEHFLEGELYVNTTK